MIQPRYIPLVLRQVWRHRTRSTLTVMGVALAMFLYTAVQTMGRGVDQATRVTAADQTLVVYRANRFCPATSRLPEHYGSRIARIAGVQRVVPVKIVVNNCRAALDVVTYRGVPPESLADLSAHWDVTSGSIEAWHARSDAAIVGERLAQRRGLRVGDAFDSAGVTVTVAAIMRSSELQEQNVAFVHLPFLQQAARGAGLGVVTQFNVHVEDPAALDAVAKAIDAEFQSDAEPTSTRPEKAFVAQAAGDIVEIVRFTRVLAWGCLAAVLALVANAIILSVQDRVRDHAVLQTLGFRSGLIARLIIAEGVVIGAAGGAIGSIAAAALVHFAQFTLSAEGLSVHLNADAGVMASGVLVAALVGIGAGLVPAWQASRRDIVSCFRAV